MYKKNKLYKLSISYKIFNTFYLIKNLDDKYFLLLKNTNSFQYIKLPIRQLIYDNDKLILYFATEMEQFLFISTLQTTMIENSYRKKLSIFGLGFKLLYKKKAKKLRLKLGQSHKKILKVPKEISNVFTSKKNILIESSDKIILGNFVSNLFSYKKYDSYKGKGLAYSSTIKKLKLIKKK